jgi:hypothetical protein
MEAEFAPHAGNPSAGGADLPKKGTNMRQKEPQTGTSLLASARQASPEVAMKPFSAGTLAGAGSFECETCGFAVALHEQDEVPDCPSCGGGSFRRSSMFGTAVSNVVPRSDVEHPRWLDEARSSLVTAGDYLAYDSGARAVAVLLKQGWTRIGRSLSADLRLDDPTVSRRHALIYRDEAGAKVLDDRSLNGVFRNGERVELGELADGDTLTVGRFNIHFITLDGVPANSPVQTGGTTR